MKINKKLLMAALASAVIVSAPQAKAYTLSNAESVATNTGIGLSEEKPQAAVRAPQEETEPNYAEDEAKIKDFSGSERYRSTQLEQGGGPYTSFSNKENINEFIDGFRYRNLEPSATSPDKTLWGFEIELDKEKAQRTYTDFYFTNTGNLAAFVNTGSIPANDVGKRIGKNFKDPTYKSTAEIIVDGQRAQRNFNLYANEEDLKYINSIENKNIVMAWQSNYLKDNPNGPLWATQGPSSAYGFAVNPWPNENDMLSLIKLNGSHNKKEFVQGQTITTDITIENLDDNARKRLVGQVYHPITGEIVPGAKAYINNQDKVVIEMPDGVIDEDGNLNTDSIFYSDPNYKALQNLEVKFLARPRTAEEFTIIANDNEGTYTPTGAGTATINHKGENVEIDLQGIDRYDHYNEIGRFKINLDDTRYYDQGFIDGNDDDTSKHTSSAVKPGEELEVELYVPEDKKDKDVFPNQKTPEEMEAAKNEKQAVGTIDWQFINKINEGKKSEDQWKLEYDESTLPTTFKITPPKSAKAGEFVAVPLTYTYTNGSTDTHWFHFVVQESTNNRPDYFVQVDYPSEEQKSTPKLPEDPDDKKLTPQSYSIPEGTEFKDNKGNEWTVSIDNTTGEVTAKPNDPSKFDGGETLTVPVVAHYKDPNEPDKDITEETKAEFVIKERANMTPRYNAKAGKAGDELSSEVILDNKDQYNRKPTKFTIESNTYTDDKGNTWVVAIDQTTGKVTATVPNPEDGKSIDGAIINVPVTAYYYEKDGKEVGTRQVDVQFIASGTTGTHEKTIEIPFETKVEKNPDLKKGEILVVQEGKPGSKKVTYTIKDSKVIKEEETDLIYPQDRLIQVGEGVNDGTHKIEEKSEVPYEIEIEFSDDLKPGEQEVVQEGVPGEKTRTTTLTIEDGKVTKTEEGKFEQNKAPINKKIKVGRNTEGKVEHKEKIPFKYTVEYDSELKAGEYRVETPGRNGERITTWTIKNSKVDGDPKVVETKPIDAVIKVGNKDFTGEFKTTKTESVEFETEYKVNKKLKPGEVKEIQKGELGEKETPVTHTIVNGKVTKSVEGETKQTKAPVKRIVEVGPGTTDGTHTYTSKKPFEVEVRVNPKLKKGEYNVVQKGVEGEEEYTITIENSKVTSTSEAKETKAPVKEIIEVGSEDYTGTVEYVDKDPIPFETEVTVDPSLKPGEIVEDQKGELGEQETKVTRTIKNGEAGEENRGETTVTKEPVKRKIRVGSKTDGQYKETETIPFEVEVRKDPSLKKGEWKYAEIDGVQQTGESGLKERIITIVNSKVTEESEFKTTREPKNAVILVGDDSTEGEVKHTEEIPFGYKVEESDELKPGEYKIVKPGKVGTITTTWTIKDSKVVGDPKVERVEPEDALIQVGKGTPDGTHDFKEKKEIPFETIIEYDDSLEPGEEKVVQEGKPGEQERTNTIVIENGKVKEIKEGTFKTTTEPVNKIVKIGKKKPEGETTKTVEKEIPFETKIIYDDTKDAGFQEIEKEGKPGKEKVTITTKLVDGKLVTTESTEKIEEKEDRVVRIGVKPVVKETEIPGDTEYRYNPELKEGEEKVIEEGSKGKVEYTITFNKEKGKIEVTEKRTEPTNKIVEIGYKTDGKVKVESEIPFEVEIIEDPEMEAGKTEVVQEGKLGKKETIVTIENSKEVSREENIIEKPVKKIIKVGTKNVCEIPPVDPKDPKDPETPGGKDPKDPKDPDQPGGKDPKDPEQPGGKDPKDPEQPGGKDPKEPEKPGGKDPKEPEQPGGKDPKDPEQPGGKDPKDPEQPGGKDPKDPEQPGGKDPKDPEQPGGKDPKDPESEEGRVGKECRSRGRRDQKNTKQTGENAH
ncbi:Putative surface protein precursor [Finegoldia magna]|uniref:Surface protein n=2 Tax=Finegoldia magna TaxID=1260 RepID=A0A6N2ZIN2_FINMA